MSENFEKGESLGNGETEKPLDSFEWEGKQVSFRYAKSEDRESIINIDKARAAQRLKLLKLSPEEIERIGIPEPELTRIKKQNYEEKLAKPSEEFDMTVFEKSLSDSTGSLYILLTVENNAVGYINLGAWPEADKEHGFADPSIWVFTISLLEDYQGKRFDRGEGEEKQSFSHALLEHGVDEARGLVKDAKRVALLAWMSQAKKFWKKEHFEEVKTIETGSTLFVKELE